MRKSFLLLAGVGAVLLGACSGDKKASINDDLKKDLELASSSDGITLANSSPNAGQQVVSAIEQTTKPPGVSNKVAPSKRVRTHRAVPSAPPKLVKVQAPATTTESVLQTVVQAPAGDEGPPVSARPQPTSVSYPSGSSSGGDDGRVSSGGSTAGSVIGTILGAVIRGGVVGDVDNCDPRTEGRNPSVNNRIPGRSGGRISTGPVGGGIVFGRRPRF